jgi:hypothetical protein
VGKRSIIWPLMSYLKSRVIAILGASLLFFACPSFAEGGKGGSDFKTQARQAFNSGVSYVKNGQYSRAAQAFLQADSLIPSSQALSNAIAAARKANDYLLVSEASLRAIGRADADPALAAKAREALVEAEKHLAIVNLNCEPMPCSMKVNGKAADVGKHHLLPGTYVFEAFGLKSSYAHKRLDLLIGSAQQLVLNPEVKIQNTPPAKGTQPSAPSVIPINKAVSPPNEDRKPTKPLPPAVFVVSGVVSSVLLIATTWSGIDTLKAKRDLPSQPTTSQVDNVRSRIFRSNVLFGATAAASVGTAVIGLFFTQWSSSKNTSQSAKNMFQTTSEFALEVRPNGGVWGHWLHRF